LASLVTMTDTLCTFERAASSSSAIGAETAVPVPGACADSRVVVAGACAQDAAGAVGMRRSDQLLERFGPVVGVGDAIWRALSTVSAEIVCVSSEWPLESAQIERLTQPLIEDSRLMLVSGVTEPHQRRDDRLAELVARPLVARYAPALVGLRQPLLGSFAARRSLLRTVAFPVGAGVRLSLLLDAILGHGREAVAEVAVQTPALADRPLRELGADAGELIVAMRRRSATTRAIADERLVQPWNDLSRLALATEERPALERIFADDDARASWPNSDCASTLSPVAVIVPDTDWSEHG
jgi:glucosyl-3-phosphoglycerate synthase